MLNESVKLPRKVAEAIKHLKTHHGDNQTILAGILGNANGSCIVTLREYIKENGFDKLLQALVNHYEIEETSEDKVRTLYDYFDQKGIMFAGADVRNKIARILTMLDIPIAGVNHE